MNYSSERKKSILFTVITVVLIAVLVISGIMALNIYFPQKREQQKFESLKQSVVYQKEGDPMPKNKYGDLIRRNGDFAGWLKIDDTSIDYPVMKPDESDPEFYLRRNFDKQYSFPGTLFVGGNCNMDSDSFVIYGHNMVIDTMFGELDSYADDYFAREHPYISLDTRTQSRQYKVFAAFQTKIYADSDDNFKYYEHFGTLSEDEYDETVQSVRNLSKIDLSDMPQNYEQLLFLSTCSYHTQNGRFVVVAYRVK